MGTRTLATDEPVKEYGEKISFKKSEKKVTKEIDDFLSDYQDNGLTQNLKQDSYNSDTSNNDSPTSDFDLGISVKKKRGRKAKKQTIIAGEVINGMLFLSLVDIFMPLLIKLIHDLLDPKTKISADKLKLTAKQKNELEPIVDEVVKQWDITANPTAILVFSLLGIYSANYMMLRTEAKYA